MDIGILTATVPVRLQLVALAFSAVLLWSVVSLIRREKLKEGYSIIWFFIGFVLVIFSVFTRLLDIVAQTVGIAYTPAALFIILIGSLFLLALHYSAMITKHNRAIRDLVQEIGLLRAEHENDLPDSDS